MSEQKSIDWKPIIVIIIAILSLIIGGVSGDYMNVLGGMSTLIKTDTTYITTTDTIKIASITKEFVPFVKWKERIEYISVPNTDTLIEYRYNQIENISSGVQIFQRTVTTSADTSIKYTFADLISVEARPDTMKIGIGNATIIIPDSMMIINKGLNWLEVAGIAILTALTAWLGTTQLQK